MEQQATISSVVFEAVHLLPETDLINLAQMKRMPIVPPTFSLGWSILLGEGVRQDIICAFLSDILNGGRALPLRDRL